MRTWWRERGVVAGSALIMVMLVAYQLYLWGTALARWDWLLLTGVAVFLSAYNFSRGFPTLVVATVHRLWDRGVIGAEAVSSAPEDAARPQPVDRVVRDLERTAARVRWPWAAGFAVAMAALWVVAFDGLPWRNWALWLTVPLSGVAGGVVGRLVAYGRLAAVLRRNGLPPRPQPGHVDGAAGLRPVGELYLRQATVVAAIGVFAGVWWVLMGFGERYAYWRGPYVGVMLAALGCEVVAFVAPLWSFHRIMAADKRQRIREADRTSRRIHELRLARSAAENPAKREPIDAEIDRLSAQWRDVEDMPTWPVDASVRRRFTWNNVALLVPFVLKSIAAPRWWQELTETLARMAG